MSEIVIFEGGTHPGEVRLEGETLWATQSRMADLFGTSTDNIGLHLKNIYSEGELVEPATTEEFLVVRQEGKRQVRRRLKHCNLDTVIAVRNEGWVQAPHQLLVRSRISRRDDG